MIIVFCPLQIRACIAVTPQLFRIYDANLKVDLQLDSTAPRLLDMLHI